jgi:hypothetical protein
MSVPVSVSTPARCERLLHLIAILPRLRIAPAKICLIGIVFQLVGIILQPLPVLLSKSDGLDPLRRMCVGKSLKPPETSS